MGKAFTYFSAYHVLCQSVKFKTAHTEHVDSKTGNRAKAEDVTVDPVERPLGKKKAKQVWYGCGRSNSALTSKRISVVMWGVETEKERNEGHIAHFTV